MKPFNKIRGVAAPLAIANIDTDQIIPKQFLKTVSREGLSRGLFYDFRIDAHGNVKSDFVLNQARYRNACILIAGDNFGCGSSREHAPWALEDFGIRCVISSRFADIFYNNCLQNGLLPAVVSSDDLSMLLIAAEQSPGPFTVDLVTESIIKPNGRTVPFTIEFGHKEKLLKGLDAIGEALASSDSIDLFELERRNAFPWLERALVP